LWALESGETFGKRDNVKSPLKKKGAGHKRRNSCGKRALRGKGGGLVRTKGEEHAGGGDKKKGGYIV